MPGAGNDVTIYSGGNDYVTLDVGTSTIHSLTLGGASNGTTSYLVDAGHNETLTILQGLTVGQTGILQFTGSGSSITAATVSNDGSITIGAGATLNLTNQPNGVTDVPVGASWTIGGNFSVGGVADTGFANLASIEGAVSLQNGQTSTISPSSGLTITGTLDVGQATSLTVNGDLNLSGSDYGTGISVSGTSTLTVAGNVNNTYRTIGLANSTMTVSGDLNNTAYVVCYFYGCFANGGDITLDPSSLSVSGNFNNTAGTVSLSNGSSMFVGKDFNNSNSTLGGVVDLSGSTLNVTGTFNNVYSALELSGGSSATIGSNFNNSSGSVSLSGGSKLLVGGAFTNSGGTSVSLAGSGDILTALGYTNGGGSLSIGAGALMDVRAGSTNTFTDLDSTTGTLHGGSYYIAGTFRFDPGSGAYGGNIVNIGSATSLTLDGSGAAAMLYGPGAGMDALTELASNAGSLTLLDGRTLTTPSGFTNSGNLSLQGGSGMTVGGDFSNSSGNVGLSGGSKLLVAGAFTDSGHTSVSLAGNGDVLTALGYTNGGGSLSIGAGALVDVRAGSTDMFTDLDSTTGTLHGGSYYIAGTFRFDPGSGVYGGNIVNIGSGTSLTLDGSGAAAMLYGPGAGTDALTELASNAGSLTLLNGRTLTTPGGFTNSGNLSLQSGSGMTVGGGFSNSSGNVGLSGGSSLAVAGAFSNSSGDVSLSGGSKLSVAGAFTDSGNTSVSLAGNGDVLTALGYTNGGGSLSLGVGALMDVRAGSTDTFTDLDSTTGTLHGGSYYIAGTFRFDPGSGAYGGNIVNIGSGTSLTLDGSGAAAMLYGPGAGTDALTELASNAGVLELLNGRALTTPNNFVNSGNWILNNSAAMSIGGNVNNSGQVLIENASSLHVAGGFVSSTLITLENSSALSVGGAFNNSNGSIGLYGGDTLSINGALTDNALSSVTLSDSSDRLTALGFTKAGGGISIGSGSVMDVRAGGTDTFSDLDSTTGTLHGGSYYIAGTFLFDPGSGAYGGNIVNIASDTSLTLDGRGPAAMLYGPGASDALTELASNAGTLELLNGRVLTTPSSFTNSGTFNIENGAGMNIGGDFHNSGTTSLSNSSVLAVQGNLSNDTTISLNNANTLTVGGSANNAGDITLNFEDTLTVTGNFTNAYATNLYVYDNSVASAGSFVNNGSAIASGSGIFNVTGLFNNVLGTSDLEVLNNSRGSVFGLTNTGMVYVDSTSSLVVTGPAGSFTNFDVPSGTLSGGFYNIDGVFQFADADIKTIAADVTLILQGTPSLITPDGSTDGLINLASNAGYVEFDSRSIALTGSLNNSGSLFLDSIYGQSATVSMAGDFTNSGMVQILGVSQNLIAHGNFSNSGTVIVDGSNTTLQAGGFGTNSGNITVFETSTLSTGSDFTNLAGGKIVVGGTMVSTVGGAVNVGGNFNNAGEIDIYGGSGPAPGMLTAQGTFTNSGTINLLKNTGGAAGGTLISGMEFTNSGNVYIDPTAELIVLGQQTYKQVGASSSTTVFGTLIAGQLDIEAGNFYQSGALETTGPLSNSGVMQIAGSMIVGGVSNTGTLQVNSGANLTSTGLLLQFDSGTGTLLGGDFDVSGTFQFPDANIVNIGAGATLILRGDHYLITPGGDVNALAGLANNFGTLEFDNLSFETLGGFGNFGDLSFGGGGGGDFGFNGDLSNGGFIDLTGNNWMVTAQNLNNIGTLDLEGVADMFRVQGFFNAGYVRVRQGSTLATEVDFSNLSSGYVQVDGGSSYPTGGLLTVGGDFTNAGKVKVLGGNGEGPGMLTTTGLFTNTSSGMLELDSGIGAPGGQVIVSSIVNDGGIYIGSGATLNLTNQPGGVTDVPMGASWQIYGNFTEGGTNFGFENLTSIEGAVQLENQQSSTINPLGGTLTLTDKGALDIGNGTALTITGNVDNSGFLSTGRYNAGGNALTITGTLTNEASASFALNGAIDSATIGGLTNSGTVDMENGSTLQISGDVTNSGTLETNFNGNGGMNTIVVNGLLTNTATGQISLNGPGDVLQALAGLSNNGVINVNGGSSIDPPFVNNGGTINIGAGSKMIVGTGMPIGTGYIQLANGTLGEIINSNSNYGVINVTGSALLAGTLDIMLKQGFNPIVGTEFTILTSSPGLLSGTFANIVNDCFNNQTECWGVTYDRADGLLELTAQPNGGPPPVSEPATLLVLIPGLLGMGYGLRRRLLK